MHRIPVACGIALFALLAGPAVGAPAIDRTKGDGTFDAAKLPPDAKTKVDFVRDVRPLLEAHCWKCHATSRHESGLRLNRKETAFAGGDSGKEFEPGKSAESRLIRYVSGLDSDTVMPPDGEGERLSAQQVGLLRAWIDQGANWPKSADSLASTLKTHWAYVRPKHPPIPHVKRSGWARNEIDDFVLARLEKEGLSPQPEEDRARLDPAGVARFDRAAADDQGGRCILGRQEPERL